MKKIKELVNHIDDELEGAKEYAEMYLELKAKNQMQWASKFKQMAQVELDHSAIVHDYAVSEIDELKKVYTPPIEMVEKWDKEHKEYVEKSAWIRQMLVM